MADATTEALQRFIEMHELVALGVVDARQLVARAVPRQSAGEIR